MSQQGQSPDGLPGTVLDGAYRIERLVGEGGMGTVYQATHLRLDKRVAIKVMARELAANPEALARFRREAQVTSALGHPHIVQVFDFGTMPTGELYLVMEFLEGEDLDCRLRRQGRLAGADTVHIVKQVASALAATHAKAIVHRDLKPGNIYLLEVAGETDFVKVLDFGISKVRSATTKLTRTSSVVGTPNYMSPEQANGRIEDIDERTDQWALACIAWECLSGESPFVGENVPSILFQIVHKPPPPLLPKVAGLHPQVEDVLLRALAKNKDDRFPSVNDFATALETALAAASATSSGVARTVQLNESPSASAQRSTFSRAAGEIADPEDTPPTRSRKWMWGAAFGAAAILVTGLLLLFRPGTGTPAVSSPSRAVPAAAPAAEAPPPAKPSLPAAEAPPTGLAPTEAAEPSPSFTTPALAAPPRPTQAKPKKKRTDGAAENRPTTAPASAAPPATPPAPAQESRPSVGPKGGMKW